MDLQPPASMLNSVTSVVTGSPAGPHRITRSAMPPGVLREPVELPFLRPKQSAARVMTISKTARKSWLAMLSYAQEQWRVNPSLTQFAVPATRLRRDIEMSGTDYKRLAAILESMVGSTLEWRDRRDDGSVNLFSVVSLLSYAAIDRAPGSSQLLVRWSYSPHLARHLSDPLMYSTLNFLMHNRFSRYASMVLYDIGNRYMTSPSRLTPAMTLEDWRPLLTGTADLTPEQRKAALATGRRRGGGPLEYRFFKRDVLNTAIDEVNAAQSEFALELIEHRRRDGSLNTLQFRVRDSANPRALEYRASDGLEHEKGSQRDQLIDLGVSERQAERLCKEHPFEEVAIAIENTLQRMRQPGMSPLTSAAAYITTDLRSGRARARLQLPPELRAEQKALDWSGDTTLATTGRKDGIKSETRAHLSTDSSARVPVGRVGIEGRTDGAKQVSHATEPGGEKPTPPNEKASPSVLEQAAGGEPRSCARPRSQLPPISPPTPQQAARMQSKLRQEYVEATRVAASAIFMEAGASGRRDWISLFESQALPELPDTTRVLYAKRGLEAPLVRAAMMTWMGRVLFVTDPSDEDLTTFQTTRRPVEKHPQPDARFP